MLAAYDEARRTLDELFTAHAILSLDEAIKVNTEYEMKYQAVMSAEAHLRDELDNEAFETLEQQVAAFGDVSSGRQLATVVQELTAHEKDIEVEEKELAGFKKDIQSFELKYTSQDELMVKLANAMVKLREIKARLDALIPLPPEITDVNEFIQQFERAQSELESEKQKKNNLDVQRASLEGEAPEQSVEELQSKFEGAARVFQTDLAKGKGIAKLDEVVEQLLGEVDVNTFGGFIQEVADYVAKLTNNRYSRIQADEAIPTGFIRADGTSIPTDLLSTGTKDILGLALRLSVAKHFLADANGFVLMDDPLVDLDPERQERAVEVLRTFALDKQTILFTCHPTHAQRLSGNLCRLD